MKGDILIIDESHRRAAVQIVNFIRDEIQSHKEKYVITVAGESGAGKSEVAASIADKLKEFNIQSFIFGQDDYFILPPKTNASKRSGDISWVGVQEVKLDLLDQHLYDIKNGQSSLSKPLVDFNADQIVEETVDLSACKVLIAEGTYTSLLKSVNRRIFIDRTRTDTMESRKKRARETQDEFLEKILTIEHDIISAHKSLADFVITKEWDVLKMK